MLKGDLGPGLEREPARGAVTHYKGFALASSSTVLAAGSSASPDPVADRSDALPDL